MFCLFLQLFVVVMQGSKRGKLYMAREILIVLTGVKPGVDALRVASGARQMEGTVMDPRTELVATKCCELFAESIPGCGCASEIKSVIKELTQHHHFVCARSLGAFCKCTPSSRRFKRGRRPMRG